VGGVKNSLGIDLCFISDRANFLFNSWRRGLMVRRCFPVAETVGSSPADVVLIFGFIFMRVTCIQYSELAIIRFGRCLLILWVGVGVLEYNLMARLRVLYR
jgi:hypothetical protein